jgi:hypothetical protein
LFDQLAKSLFHSAPGAEQEEAEKKFKKHVSEYKDRVVQHAAKVLEEVRFIVSVIF